MSIRFSLVVLTVFAAALSPVPAGAVEGFTLRHTIQAPTPEAGDFFGGSVALSRFGLAVRSRNSFLDVRASQVHVFGIGEQTELLAETLLPHPREFSLGQDLAFSGPSALVGLNQTSVNGVGRNGVVAQFTNRNNRANGIWAVEGFYAQQDPSPGGAFGRTLATDADNLIVGASVAASGFEPTPGDPFTPNNGAAYLFAAQDDGRLIETAKLVTNNLTPPLFGPLGPRFGTSVDLSGDTAVVSAIFDDIDQNGSLRGSAFVFQRDQEGAWNEVAKLLAPEGAGNFGTTVAIDGDTILSTSPRNDTVYLYQNAATDGGADWRLQDAFTGGEGATFSSARSVAIEDDLLVVGFHDGTGGWVDVYRKDVSNQWGFHETLLPPNPDEPNFFGFTLAIASERLAVSDPGFDGFEEGATGPAGSVHLYEFVDLPPLAGDYNADGVVDTADYAVWRDNLGTDFDLNGAGDETGDSAGVVDRADYARWAANVGETSGGAVIQSVPEPTAATLLLAGAVAGFACRPLKAC